MEQYGWNYRLRYDLNLMGNFTRIQSSQTSQIDIFRSIKILH